MTEKEKMISGALYKPTDPELVQDRDKARSIFRKINSMPEEAKEERNQLFYSLFGNCGENLWIEPPFYCDYGYNITLGKNVFMNFNCCILDVAPVTIGDNVFIAPNVQLYAATHPIDAKTRISGVEYGEAITIGNDVWIGGNVTICPGVKIGNGVVIGAGSVVTKDIPDNVVVAGNPARVIKNIDN